MEGDNKKRIAEKQALAKDKKHCLCDISIKCPCNWYESFGECACAGADIDTKKWVAYNHKTKQNEEQA